MCFTKLKLLLIAVEAKGDNGMDSYIAINPGPTARIEYATQGFFIAQSADEVGFCCCRPDFCYHAHVQKCRQCYVVFTSTQLVKELSPGCSGCEANLNSSADTFAQCTPCYVMLRVSFVLLFQLKPPKNFH